MKKRFSDEQIISIFSEAEAGVSTQELCRRHAISDATFYTWRKKFGAMEVPEVKRLSPITSTSPSRVTKKTPNNRFSFTNHIAFT
ncbi:IS66 family insertion sequence element accessory protein TnpA [Pantoea allii]|uniref:IS66 family insertion sequence element accessory protein TnpA n=1 Tax=Pantoea allii TaxID=574096 RepID=UPI003FCC8AC1